MSTRCQVHITGQDISGGGKFTLYHHCDGYPTYMLPIIAKAYEQFMDNWQVNRVGKAAVLLTTADPMGYELEESHDLHGDIEFYYIVTVNDGWKVQTFLGDGVTALHAPLDVSKAAEQAESIEKKAL